MPIAKTKPTKSKFKSKLHDLAEKIPVRIDAKTTVWVKKGTDIKAYIENLKVRNEFMSNRGLNYFGTQIPDPI